MPLDKIVSNLSNKHQLELAVVLIEKALVIWDEYCIGGKLDYIDTVVGMHHEVKPDLPARSLALAKKELQHPGTQAAEIKALNDEFIEPIVAMQDDDWEMPDAVEKVFYAAYNLNEFLNGLTTTTFAESQIYLVINQAIDALLTKEIMTLAEINNLIAQYKKQGYRPE